jgi:hypothetical protein
MFNLLPYQEKVALKKEYRYRQAFIWSGAVAIVAAIAIALLIPAYVLSITRNNSLKIEKESAAITAKRNAGGAAEVVARAELLSRSLSTIPDADVSSLAATVISARPAGIVILRLGFSSAVPAEPEEGEAAPVVDPNPAVLVEVQGVARSREALRRC